MKNPKKLMIYGTGDTAALVHYYFTNDSDYEPVAFCQEREFITNDTFLDLPVFPFDEIKMKFSPTKYSFFCAIGYIELNKIRKETYLMAKTMGYSMASYISSVARIAKNVTIGEHCFIDAIRVYPYSTIGDNCFIHSDIGHDCTIGDHCFISQNASLGGRLKIGEQTLIGLNATIKNNIEIGSKNIIGSGSIILSSTASNSIFIQKSTQPFEVKPDSFDKIACALFKFDTR